MKLKHLYILLNTLLCLNSKAQVNLVSNPSFEDTVGNQCFSQMGVNQLGVLNPFLKNWYSSSNFGSPDYMNVCANPFALITFNWTSSVPLNRYGYQVPRTGSAYVGMGTYIVYDPNDSNSILVEYISVKLNQVLKPNICYYTEFYASMADYCEISINQLSILFTQNTFTTATGSFTNTIQPQVQWDTIQYFTDTLNWVKISGSFVAQGGEQYLSIGNFKDGVHTKKIGITSNFITPETTPGSRKFSFVFIDDVSLYELPNHSGIQSYTLCAGDSLLLGDTTRLPVRYQWSLNNTVIDTINHIIVKPTQTNTYVLQTKHCTTQTQTITIVVNNICNPTPIIETTIPNVFTPNGDGINDVFTFSVVGATNVSFNIMNRWGNLIQSVTSRASVTNVLWDGRTTSGEACSEGVYFYTLEYKDSKGDVIKKNGYVSLLR